MQSNSTVAVWPITTPLLDRGYPFTPYKEIICNQSVEGYKKQLFLAQITNMDTLNDLMVAQALILERLVSYGIIVIPEIEMLSPAL